MRWHAFKEIQCIMHENLLSFVCIDFFVSDFKRKLNGCSWWSGNGMDCSQDKSCTLKRPLVTRQDRKLNYCYYSQNRTKERKENFPIILFQWISLNVRLSPIRQASWARKTRKDIKVVQLGTWSSPPIYSQLLKVIRMENCQTLSTWCAAQWLMMLVTSH